MQVIKNRFIQKDENSILVENISETVIPCYLSTRGEIYTHYITNYREQLDQQALKIYRISLKCLTPQCLTDMQLVHIQ